MCLWPYMKLSWEKKYQVNVFTLISRFYGGPWFYGIQNDRFVDVSEKMPGLFQPGLSEGTVWIFMV